MAARPSSSSWPSEFDEHLCEAEGGDSFLGEAMAAEPLVVELILRDSMPAFMLLRHGADLMF